MIWQSRRMIKGTSEPFLVVLVHCAVQGDGEVLVPEGGGGSCLSSVLQRRSKNPRGIIVVVYNTPKLLAHSSPVGWKTEWEKKLKIMG